MKRAHLRLGSRKWNPLVYKGGTEYNALALHGLYGKSKIQNGPDLSDFIVRDAMYIQSLAYFLIPKLAFSANSVIKANFMCHRGSSGTKSEMYVFSGYAMNTQTGQTGQSTFGNYRIIMNPSQNTFQNHFLHESLVNYGWNGFSGSSPSSFNVLDNRIQVEFCDTYGKMTYGGTQYNLSKTQGSTKREMKFSEYVPFVIGIPEGALRTSTNYSFEGYIYSIELDHVINDFTGTITPSDYSNYDFVDVLLKPALKISTQETCFVDVNSGKYYPLTGGTATLVNLS